MGLLNIVNSYLSKESTKLLYSEATKLYQEGNYDLAKQKLSKLLELEPENKKAFILLKLTTTQKLILEKKYKEAKSELFEAIKVEPENEEVLELLKKIDTLLELNE